MAWCFVKFARLERWWAWWTSLLIFVIICYYYFCNIAQCWFIESLIWMYSCYNVRICWIGKQYVWYNTIFLVVLMRFIDRVFPDSFGDIILNALTFLPLFYVRFSKGKPPWRFKIFKTISRASFKIFVKDGNQSPVISD